MAKRKLKNRIWFYRPEWYFVKLAPVLFGNDEYHWKTLVLGFPFTGQIVIALHEFDASECELGCPSSDYPGWPVSIYEWEEK